VLRFCFSSRRRHTRLVSDWSSDVCSSDLVHIAKVGVIAETLLDLGQLSCGPPSIEGHRKVVLQFGLEKGVLPRMASGDLRLQIRSEERRVGKECRARRWADD